MKSVFVSFLVLALLAIVQGQANFATNQLTTSGISERAQRALFPIVGSFHLPISTGLPATNIVDNAAARQLQADKSAFPFLGTLPGQGSSNFFTVLKPCGIIGSHVHPRGTEQYLLITGQQLVGIAEENGGRQNTTFTVTAGQAFVVPQGLVHFNANQQCTPNVFVQSFSSADAGTIGISGALAGLRGAAPDVLAATNFSTVAASPFGAFALDPACLARCNLPATGGGVSGLSQEMQVFLGLAPFAGGPSTAPVAAASTSGSTAASTAPATAASTARPPAGVGGPISG